MSPGGAEIYAEELHQAMQQSGEFDSTFIARIAPSCDVPNEEQPRIVADDSDPTLHYIRTAAEEFDRLLWTTESKRLYVEDWATFLREHEPDIVHFHHSSFLGYDMIRATRRTLPDAAIVYTLHDFGPICHHNGQMVRTGSFELCRAASPSRCHRCFPRLSPDAFLFRERFVKSALGLVDLFIAPSEHARRRFIDWGLPADRVVHEDYGRFPVPAVPEPPGAGGRRRFAFFGQVTQYKGIDVLLEAMRLLHDRRIDARLLLFASGIERIDPTFARRLTGLLSELTESVEFPGRYDHGDLPRLMADIDWVVVPSIWWETGPLVIHEARVHRRPVICSDIGAMVERVEHGVSGLHFRAGDPASLADAIQRAATTPGLWDELRDGITEPHSMDAHLEEISRLYRQLRARSDAAVAA